MHADARERDAERALGRQSLMHHRKREEQLEQTLAHLIATACQKPHCKCDTTKQLRRLADELNVEGADRRC